MIEINNLTRQKINLERVNKIARKFLKAHNMEKRDLSIAFVGEDEIRKLNKTYRGIDKPTDILSFEGGEDLGELVVNYAQVKKQARRFCKSPEEELAFIIVHGLLHLLGYEDDTEKGRREMIRLGEEFLNKK